MSRVRNLAGPLLLTAALTGAIVASPASSTELLELPALDASALADIAHIDLPPAGVTLEIHADFPAENPLTIDGVGYTAITASIDHLGGVQTHSAVADTASSRRTAVDECSDSFFSPTGRKWNAEDLPVVWRFRRGSVPQGLGLFRTQRALRDAHSSWVTSRSTCTDADRIDFDWKFGNLTNKQIAYDGVNVIDFGSLDGGALAINYTWYDGTRILETDMRLNKRDYRWTNRAGGKRHYQVVNVVTHELGHQIGLDDLSDPHAGLTMFGRIERGETNKVTLGQGDVRGATVLSP